MGPSSWNIVLQMPATARGWRVTVLIYQADSDELLATDEGNLMSLTGRKKMAQRLGELLGLDEPRAKVFGAELDKNWLAFYQEYQRRMAAGPAQESAAELLAQMPPEVQQEAEVLLQGPDLVSKIRDDIEALGIAGECELALTIYLTGVSRLLDKPLASRVHGPTSSGKSYIIRKVADLFPAETCIHATQITPQAFFHMEKGSLQHRFVIGGERSRKEDDETADTTRALRELLADGKLSKLIAMKGPGGQIETLHIEQPGPIAFVESTSAAKVFEEDANRCLTLFTDERPRQTERIVRTLAAQYQGVKTRPDMSRIVQRHHALQRLLQPFPVVIPYAPRLGELLNCERVEARRAFPQIMSTIQGVTLLHQWQRERDGEGRLVSTAADYELARRLLLRPMMRLLGGGISEPAKRFYERLRHWVTGPFTSTEVKRHETNSKAAVYGWLVELHEAGVLKVVAEARGRSPATWELAGNDPEVVASVLPPLEELYQVEETHGHNT